MDPTSTASEIHVRVPLRSRIGTTIIWNTDSLTEEERKCVTVQVRLGADQSWFVPKTTQPPMQGNLAKLMDGHTGAIMIPHMVTGRIFDSTRFDLCLMFGREGKKNAFLEISPLNAYTPFTKPKLIEVDGQKVYTEPVYIAGFSQGALNQIATMLKSIREV